MMSHFCSCVCVYVTGNDAQEIKDEATKHGTRSDGIHGSARSASRQSCHH
jgi:hypothetical protein